jgi:hypothetical protein
MLIRDKKLKLKVDVWCAECASFACYWPRPDPGMFTQGQGYRERSGGSKGWLCGTREIKGCPAEPVIKQKSNQ